MPVFGPLSEFCVIFSRNLLNLFSRELLLRCAGWRARVAEEAVETGRGDDPEQEKFVVGVEEPVPGVFGDVYDCVLFKGVRDVVQDEGSAAFEDVEGLVHFEVAVDRDACPGHHLLGSHGQIVGAGGGAELDVDIAAITEVEEVFAFGHAEHVPLTGCGLGFSAALRECVMDAHGPNAEESSAALLFEWVHDSLPGSA